MAPKQQFAMVPIHQIITGANVRRDLGDLDGLVASIREHGILEPLVGCPSEDRTSIEILMGHRRLEAARLAGLDDVPMVLRQGRPSKRQRVLMQLVENLQRTDMSPIDEALAFKELVDQGFSQIAIGREVGRSNTDISKRLKLLEMPDTIRMAVDLGWIAPSVAFEIPRSHYTDKKAMQRLAQVIQHGHEAVRDWIKVEARRADDGRVGPRVKDYVVTRTVGIRPAAYDAAIAAAKTAGMTVVDWMSDVVLNAAETESRGTAA